MPITLQEAFEDLHDRMMKQIAEKVWEIERIIPLKGKAFEEFAGSGAKKNKYLLKLKIELRERQTNLDILIEIIKKYADKPRGEK